MFGIRVNSNMDRLAANLERRFGPFFAQEFLKAAEIVASEIRREINAFESQTSTRKTGMLARSFLPAVGRDAFYQIEGGVYSDSKYARIQDQGGTITPRNGSYLTIPLTNEASRVRARNFPGGLVFVHHPPALPVLAKQLGPIAPAGVRSAGLEPQYLLVRSATLKGHGYLDKAAASSLPQAQSIVNDALQKALTDATPPPVAA